MLQYGQSNHCVLIGIREEKGKEIKQYPYSIEIQAITTSPRQINKFLCTEIEESICQNLPDIIGTFPSSENPYQIGYRCIIKRYNDRSEGCIVLENKMQTELDCCNCAPVHTVDVKSILSFWKGKLSEKGILMHGREIPNIKTGINFGLIFNSSICDY